MSSESQEKLGATYLGHGRCQFCVWAPQVSALELHLLSPRDCLLPMEPRGRGYFRANLENLEPGSLYCLRLHGSIDRPDPATRFQPRGVHGPSQVVDPRFLWDDLNWHGLPLSAFIFYELHVGTFTPEGTFEAIIPRLPDLKNLGITAIELMPIAQFPGSRNWGYDGVNLFAPQNTYGGPEGLKRLVNACHQHGLAAVLDVVYNHLGPEGNYLAEYGPYFTERYKTPWGPAVNFDGPHSDEVRHFFIENALYWVRDFHIDALRLDAVHAIFDRSAYPFLQELADAVRSQADLLNRQIHLIAETNLNDSRLTRSAELHGFGLDAQWNDDFHHALRTVLTGEHSGYYQDFGQFGQLVEAYRHGYVYSGNYSSFRQRRHGNSSRSLPAHRFVVFSQNHDQVGNRMLGERLTEHLSLEELKLAAGAVLLSPFIPLLFMGEEYGETAPFQYFVNHSDVGLIEAVRSGRKEEFASFAWQGEPPDPQDESTFLRCKLNHELREQGRHKVLWCFIQELIALRRTHPALSLLSKERMELVAFEKEATLCVRRWSSCDEALLILNFGDLKRELTFPFSAGRWLKLLDSCDKCWLGNGSSCPNAVDSQGEVTLNVNSKSLLVFGICSEMEMTWVRRSNRA